MRPAPETNGPAKSGLEIRLLGEITVLRDGKPCSLPSSKKTRALLGFLVSNENSVTRERLCDLFWDGPDDPRGGLRWSLSKLRPLVDEAGVARLSADRDHVRFERAGANVDLFSVRALVKHGMERAPLDDLCAAAQKFRGPFLEAHDLSECVRYHTWCVGERERARAFHTAILHEIIGRLSATPDAALPFARALVALDPLIEASHIRLIRLLADTGRTHDALSEYKRCRSILATQLGFRPSVDLEQLRMSLGSVPRAPSVAPKQPAVDVQARHSVAPTKPTPLIGRSSEMQILEQATERARSGSESEPQIIFLHGDPGAGKSRLLEELGLLFRNAGGQMLTGRAFEAELVRPYGPFFDALLSAESSASDSTPGDLRATLARENLLEKATDRALFFEALSAHVRKLAQEKAPLALCIDDIQWLDEGSAALLHFLGRSLQEGRVLLACAARRGELADNRAALRALRALERATRVTRIAVEPLDAERTYELASRIAGSVDTRHVFAESRGNPLFVIELARALARRETEPSENLARLVSSRLEQLDAEAESVLPWAAALGRSFDVDVLSRVSGLKAASLLSGLHQLERLAVVSAAGNSVYDFVHDIVRRAAYEQISEPRRRLIHGQIATSLASAEDAEDRLAADVLHHAGLASNHELAAESCVKAGRHCLRVFAYADAWDLARRGLEHAELLSPSVRLPLRVELFGLRAQKPQTGSIDELERSLMKTAFEAENAGQSELVARVYHFLALLRYGARDESGAYQSSLKRSETARAAGSSGALHLLGAARCLANVERDMEQVEACLEDAMRIVGSNFDALDFVWGRGLFARYQGQYDEAVSFLERALDHNLREGRNWELCISLRDLVLTELERGEFERVLRRSEELFDVATKVGDGVARPAALGLRALGRLKLRETGDFSELDAALVEIRAADGKMMLATLANHGAELFLENGEIERAANYAKEGLAAATAILNKSQSVLARTSLAYLANLRQDQESLAEELAAITQQAEGRLAISARARKAMTRLFSTLGTTEPPTLDQHSRAQGGSHEDQSPEEDL